MSDTTERRAISSDEVAKHNTDEDCWISMHGLVLNLTQDILSEHPGGPDVIVSLAGKDATDDFEDIGHSDTAREWSSKYIIGYLDGSEEENKTKLVPLMSEAKRSSGEGDGDLLTRFLFFAPVVVLIAVISYFVMKE
uniref:Cytochrome b5 heme-binding domain-containing protein n=1 Tax=Noctiluca scintillans TaxID=2966 RepID=A0A7S1F778_NOCSC|mmetsp:Transcript_37965/g.101137  ORF Transcript_37965/g.101137 Transcript_37965/m.101137 type:complete len:137 (+) Transcript_37965:71-481(+)